MGDNVLGDWVSPILRTPPPSGIPDLNSLPPRSPSRQIVGKRQIPLMMTDIRFRGSTTPRAGGGFECLHQSPTTTRHDTTKEKNMLHPKSSGPSQNPRPSHPALTKTLVPSSGSTTPPSSPSNKSSLSHSSPSPEISPASLLSSYAGTYPSRKARRIECPLRQSPSVCVASASISQLQVPQRQTSSLVS